MNHTTTDHRSLTPEPVSHSSDQHSCQTGCNKCGTTHTQPDLYECGKCRKHFANLKHYQRHRQTHYNREAVRCVCNICQKSCHTYKDLIQHRKNDHFLTQDSDKVQLKCCDCDEVFDAHHKLHAHRMKHSHARVARLNDPSMKMPWEKDATVDPPWVGRDEQKNKITDIEFMQTYSENRDTIQAAHDPGIVRGVYNFPIDDFNGETVIMRPHLDHIIRHESNAFKINVAFGLILQNIETGEYRYYTAYYNNTILDHPFRINRGSDINDLLRQLEEHTSLDYIMKDRESTKWQKVYITNITYFVYRLGYLIGAPSRKSGKYTLPSYIINHHAIISLDNNNHTAAPYKDKLCAFRCLAWSINGRKQLEKRTKTLYNKWKMYQEGEGVTDLPNNARRFKGIYFNDLPDFEICFKVKLSVYTLNEDSSCFRVYQSMRSSEDTTDTELYLNLHDHHFSLITDFTKYAKKYACQFCSRLFDQSTHVSRHQKSCRQRVKYKFPGGIYSPTLTIFEELQQSLGVVVDSDVQYYPWFAVYDFESVLKPNNTSHNSDQEMNFDSSGKTEWTTTHIPVCVSIASNVEGYTEPKCFVDDDPDSLVQRMCEYLERIQEETHRLAKHRWAQTTSDLNKLKTEFPIQEITPDSMDRFNSSADVTKDVQEDGETDMDTLFEEDMEVVEEQFQPDQKNPSIGGMEHEKSRQIHADRVESITKRFEKYIAVLPVLGFNSSKYDLNLIKKYFPKHLKLTTDCDYIVKKTNQYTTIATSKFKMLDIINYLAAGCNYSKFLKAYNIKECKSYFPYEWFNDVEKLYEEKLPPYEAFFSKLKNANVLEMEHSEWSSEGRIGTKPKTGEEKYDELIEIWHQKGMTSFQDFLIHYANLDTGPFVQAAQKLQQYYFDMGVDVFKSAISAPGIARRLLFKHAKENNKYFASFGVEHEDLFYKFKKCAFGGPSIIFKRYAKVGETNIRQNPEKLCQSILGYDCNGLYLHALGMDLPVLFPIRRSEETDFKPEVSWHHLEMYHWLNWRMIQDGVHIQHKMNTGKEFPVGPYKLDGFSPATQDGKKSRGYEFHGCWTHGHDPEICSFNRDKKGDVKYTVNQKTKEGQEKKRAATKEREKYIRDRQIDLEVIYECEFTQLKKTNKDIQEHSRHMFPEFYLKHPHPVGVDTILHSIEKGVLTGFVQVDIQVPEKWPTGKERDISPYDYFSEMSPIFCNAEVHFNERGQTMQNYSFSKGSGDFVLSRKLLVGGMAAEKIFLATNLLKWYLEQGMEVTKVYEVVEYRFEKCFEGFCDFISDARRKGDVNPEQEILGETCKVLGNASYGSLLLDKTKHIDVRYVHNSHQAHLAANDPSFKSACELPGGLYEIEKSKKNINLDIPIQLAFTILQTAKLKLLQFYYNCLDYFVDRKDYEITHTDTDSLYFTLSGASLRDVIKPSRREEYEDAIYNHCYDHDESGQPFRASDHHWFPRECCERHRKHDKRERGLFKLEASGIEIIALASKTYHLERVNDSNCVKAKGINKSALINPRDMYMAALKDRKSGSAENIGFRSVNNSVMTYKQTRKGFNFYYDKREVLPDGIHTRPLKMTLNPWEDYNMKVLKAEEDCLSNDYSCVMLKHDHIFTSCTQLYFYEMALYHDNACIASDILQAKTIKKIISLSKTIRPKTSWYLDRDEIMHSIVWMKINNIKRRVILELQQSKGKLIVNPGHISHSYFTCGLSRKMAEITPPSQFPGTDMMSVFWEKLLNDEEFMQG